jgi:predicted DNA-binding transcriptional regulator YafY
MKDGNRRAGGSKQAPKQVAEVLGAAAGKIDSKAEGLVSHVKFTLFLLRNGRATVKQVVDAVGKDEKTARNWLKALVLKMPDDFEETRQHNNEVLEIRSKSALADGSDITALRVAALRLAINAFPHLRETALADELNKACDHAFASLVPGSPEQAKAQRSFDSMLVSKTRILSPTIASDLLDELVDALVGLHEIEIEYEKFDGVILREKVQPWTLLFTDEGVQLYGNIIDSPDTERIRVQRIFQTARIRSIRKQNKQFLYPSLSEYDPRKLWEHAFGSWLPRADAEVETIELAFRPFWRTWFNTTRLHPSQSEPRDLPNGEGFTVTFQLQITIDFVRWVRGYGKAVRVLSPPGLLSRLDNAEQDWP